MPRLLMRQAKLTDVWSLVADVREADAAEWRAAAPAEFDGKLERMVTACWLAAPRNARSIIDADSGMCLCMHGASPISEQQPHVGLAWLIGTNEGQRRALHIQRHWKRGIAELHARFEYLEAHASNLNTVHHFWMERLGFVRCGPSTLFTGSPGFTKFTRCRD